MSYTKPAVPALDRASRLLDLVAQSHEPVQISAAARELGLAKSSVHNLFSSLLDIGLLERSGNGVVIGGKVMHWAHAFIRRSDLVSEFVRLWEGQAQPLQETITLTVMDGNQVMYLASQAGTDPLSITFKTGMRLPAIFTATGKAMLSTYPQAHIEQLYAQGLPAGLTPYSVNSLDGFLAELHQVRLNGYSVDDQQVRTGLFCIGAPIYNFSGQQAIGGIALSVRASGWEDAPFEALSQKVLHYAQRLSQRLGAQQLA